MWGIRIGRDGARFPLEWGGRRLYQGSWLCVSLERGRVGGYNCLPMWTALQNGKPLTLASSGRLSEAWVRAHFSITAALAYLWSSLLTISKWNSPFPQFLKTERWGLNYRENHGCWHLNMEFWAVQMGEIILFGRTNLSLAATWKKIKLLIASSILWPSEEDRL